MMFLSVTRLMVVCLSLLSGAEESGSISGRITTNSGNPLQDVNVSIPGTDRGAATDEGGFYTIDRLVADEYSLKFSHIGYATVLLGGIEVESNNTTTTNITLQISAIEMPAVEITAQHSYFDREPGYRSPNFTDTISGTVIEAMTGEIICEAFVGLIYESGVPDGRATLTDSEGEYSLLQESRNYYNYFIRIIKPGYRSKTVENVKWMPDTTVIYNASLEHSLYEELHSQVLPESTGTISGIVFDWYNSPFQDVYYILYKDDEEIGVVGKTDSQGNYRIANLPPGRYDIEFQSRYRYFPYFMINIPVRPGQNYKHHINMDLVNPPYRIFTTTSTTIIPGILEYYDWDIIMPERRE